MLIANARMYAVESSTDAAWRELLAWVARAADVPLRYEPHAAPAPLDALWRRPDLGCALMCGYPFATWHDAAIARPHLLAAPVPACAGPEGAMYRTGIVVRDDSGITTPDGLRGCRFAFTTPGSQSGYQAAREWIAERALAAGGRWFGATVGPLVTPRGVVDAILRGDADAGPLDAWWLDLLERHEPATAGRLRAVAFTDWTPAPPFVCSAAVAPPVRQRLASALLEAGASDDLRPARATLGLAGVAEAEAGAYAILAQRAHAADALGYPSLQ
jgi:ABC-type phosphate/phosphonate transport system substrate-binding protein